MFVLKTPVELQPEYKDQLHAQFKEQTGEDCIILDMGLDIGRIELKREQSLWRRLFRKD